MQQNDEKDELAAASQSKRLDSKLKKERRG